MGPLRRYAADLRVYIAAGLVVVAVLLAVRLGSEPWPGAPQLFGDGAYQFPDKSYRPGGADCQAQKTGPGFSDKGAARTDACQEKVEAHRIDADQLLESRRSAQAAEQQAWFLQEQTQLNFIATVVGSLAFIAAGAAALFAWSAADHAKRAADVDERTLMELERPYVFIESPRMLKEFSRTWLDLDNETLKNKSVAAEWELVNYGRSYALVLELSSSVYIGQDLPNTPSFGEYDGWSSQVIVPSQSTRRGFVAFSQLPLERTFLEELFTDQPSDSRGKRAKCFLYVKLKYRSAQGTIDEIGSIWEYHVPIKHWIPVEIENYSYRRSQSSL